MKLMKNLKTLLALLTLTFFIACSSSDDNDTTPIDIDVKGSIDVAFK